MLIFFLSYVNTRSNWSKKKKKKDKLKKNSANTTMVTWQNNRQPKAKIFVSKTKNCEFWFRPKLDSYTGEKYL